MTSTKYSRSTIRQAFCLFHFVARNARDRLPVPVPGRCFSTLSADAALGLGTLCGEGKECFEWSCSECILRTTYKLFSPNREPVTAQYIFFFWEKVSNSMGKADNEIKGRLALVTGASGG